MGRPSLANTLWMAFLLCAHFVLQGSYFRSPGTTNAATSFEIYLPDGLTPKKRYPWILGLSPGGNGAEIVPVLRAACDQNKWILVCSNNYRNMVPWDSLAPMIMDTIQTAIKRYPVDPGRMYVTGMSGGGMCAHRLSYLYPKMVRGVITNCGAINRDFFGQPNYTRGKAVVFLASPTDFNYDIMKGDASFLRGKEWKTLWLEFPGGHVYAPPQYYAAAMKWLAEQKDDYKPPLTKEQELASLKEKLAGAEKDSGPESAQAATCMSDLADFYRRQGAFGSAEPLCQRALAIQEKLSGPESIPVAGALASIAVLQMSQNKFSDAEPNFVKALDIIEKAATPDTKLTSSILEGYAKLLYKTNRPEQAAPLYERLKLLRQNPRE